MTPSAGTALPHVVRRHPGEDHRAGSARYSGSAANAGAADDGHAVLGQQVAEHLGVLAGDGGAEPGQHAGRQPELGGDRVEVRARRVPAAGADEQLVLAPWLATISSTTGYTAARPRSMMLWPPILSTCASGRMR